MKPYVVREVNRAAINHLVHEHYLGRWPGVVVASYGLFDGPEVIGCVVFALPPRETSQRFGVRAAWELARLFIRDCTPKNTETWFMSRVIRLLRRNHQEVDLLVSYADPSAGHAGIIYRAGNWIEDGRTDQERQTPRFDYEISVDTLFGEQVKHFSRRSHVPNGIETRRAARVSKHRFIFWLRDHEKKRKAAMSNLGV